MLLAIDTSTRYAGIALVDQEGNTVQLIQWRSQRNHTVELLPAIERMLAKEQLSSRALDGIALASGPGNFSALRVGFSVAKGFALAWNTPLVAVDTLLCEAFPFRSAGITVIAVLDSGRSQLSWAPFSYSRSTEGEFVQLADSKTSTPEDLIGEIHAPTLICGEGLENHRAVLQELADATNESINLALPYLLGLRLASLAHLGHLYFSAGNTVDPTTLQPEYLRPPTITPPRTSK